MKKYIFLLFLLIILNVISINAQATPHVSNTVNSLQITYPENRYIPVSRDYKINSLVINNTDILKNDTTTCHFYFYNDSGDQIADSVMSFNNDLDYTYTIDSNNISVRGEYPYTIVCNNSNQVGFVTSFFKVTADGQEISEDTRSDSLTRAIYFIFGIGLILFFAFLYKNESMPVKYTFFIFSIIFFLIALNIITISMADENLNPDLVNFFDSFTAISFYFYWFAAGILIILWLFTFLNTWILQKNLDNARRYGIG